MSSNPYTLERVTPAEIVCRGHLEPVDAGSRIRPARTPRARSSTT
jgi:hypothetical protein